MLLNLFTPAFRTRLRHLARTVAGREARVLAAKLSPLLSVFGAVFVLQFFPGYGYVTLAFVICTALLLGSAIAFAVPAPFIALLRFIAADPSKVVLWGKRSQGRRGGS